MQRPQHLGEFLSRLFSTKIKIKTDRLPDRGCWHRCLVAFRWRDPGERTIYFELESGSSLLSGYSHPHVRCNPKKMQSKREI